MKKAIVTVLIIYALLTLYTIVCVGLKVDTPPYITSINTLSGFSFALLHAIQRLGWRRALFLLACVFCVSLLFECVGVATGWVYGPYHYTDKLGPKFLGLVPWLIPIAWFMMSYPSFIISDRLIPRKWHQWLRILTVSALGGFVMTAWDVVMDPIMVYNGHWIWDVQGAYHGIPLQNFSGWWVTVFTSLAVFMLGSKYAGVESQVKFDRLAVISYSITTLGIVLSSFLGGAGELGLIGTFVMVPWLITGFLAFSVQHKE